MEYYWTQANVHPYSVVCSLVIIPHNETEIGFFIVSIMEQFPLVATWNIAWMLLFAFLEPLFNLRMHI